tara:strand:- start:726 stop:1028 length:303 start_codon:yes stop_codon:yes gene_type:complete
MDRFHKGGRNGNVIFVFEVLSRKLKFCPPLLFLILIFDTFIIIFCHTFSKTRKEDEGTARGRGEGAAAAAADVRVLHVSLVVVVVVVASFAAREEGERRR